MLSIGDKAIDFKAKNQEGKDISLNDFMGKKIVLYFYPKDDTPGCTIEACGLRDVYDEILSLGAVVLGVSPDDENSHVKFIDKFDLPFHLLADIDHKIADDYGSWGEKKNYGKIYMGIKRMTYIIDEKGMVLKVWPKVKPEGHAKDILTVLKS
jgi:thioredoxin-dependent peroxiredoxin